MLALVAAAAGLGRGDPLSPAVHLALAGVFRQLTHLLADIDPLWAQTDADTARRWHRDRGLLSVADKARQGRQAAAWRHFGMTGAAPGV